MAEVVSKLIDRIISEGAIGMAEAARLLGTFRDGRPSHPSTPTRWCMDGVRTPDGRRLRLEHYRQAGRLMTSKAAILRFLTKQQNDAVLASAEAPARSPKQRQTAAELAEAELAEMGV